METRSSNYTKNYSSKIYNVGIYLRLSKEDETVGQSESIGNQKDFLTAYAVENEFNVIDYYIDDGYSGTNFDRPDFNRLIEDIEKGRINAVITKDLSRLGRDYITTGYYLEKYFPSKNVRYIAVNDGIDTYTEANSDITPFKAVMNDMYAKDISRKVKTAITTKKLKGEFIGSNAPYGYLKDPNNKNKLIIDEETAPIVRRIFAMFIQSQSVLGVAKDLTQAGITTPSAHKNLKGTQQKFKGLWNHNMVKRILNNPTYIGNLTQNRTQKVNYKVNKKRELPKEQWITINNTHEPIVSEEDFDMVQRLLSKKNYVKRNTKQPVEHLLSGLLFCADCDSKMTFLRASNGIMYVCCSTWKKCGRLHYCTSHRVREDNLETEVISTLRNISQKYIDQKELINNSPAVDYEKAVEHLNKEKSVIQKQIDEIKSLISSLYKDKVKGVLSEVDFIEMSKEFGGQREILMTRLESIDKEITETETGANNNQSMEQYIKEFLNFENVDRAMLTNLIDRIEIHEDKKITLKLNFAEPVNCP